VLDVPLVRGGLKMALIDVKYVKAESLTSSERAELGVTIEKGLVAIETTNPELKRKGVVVEDYVEHLLSLAE